MNVSVLYLQANEQVARTIKGRFDEGQIEFLIVSTAEEAFSVYEARQITLTLVDANIPDMKINDFISKCGREYPDMVLNVCMDVKDPAQVLPLTSNPSVLKIFIPPLDIDEMVEGVEDSIDATRIENDFVQRKRELLKEEEEFASTLERLRSSLMRQKYSYNKIEPILNSTLKAFTEMSQADKKLTDLVEKTCNKMLVLDTATQLKCGEIARIMEECLNENNRDGRKVRIEKTDSCLMGDVAKSRIADIILGTYMTVMLESMRCDDLAVSIDSEYKSSNSVQYVVHAKGKFNDNGTQREQKYAERILANIMDGYSYIPGSDEHVWKMDIENL